MGISYTIVRLCVQDEGEEELVFEDPFSDEEEPELEEGDDIEMMDEDEEDEEDETINANKRYQVSMCLSYLSACISLSLRMTMLRSRMRTRKWRRRISQISSSSCRRTHASVCTIERKQIKGVEVTTCRVSC